MQVHCIEGQRGGRHHSVVQVQPYLEIEVFSETFPLAVGPH